MSVSVLIIGAGGTLGKPLVEEFIRQKAAFKAIGILASSAERAEASTWARDQGVKVLVGSFLDPNLYAGFSHVISAVGDGLMSNQPAIIDAAITGGITHFYPSEWNSDISQPEISGMRYFTDKQLTRAHLAAKAQEHPNFRYTLFITGIFTEWSWLEFYGFDHKKLVANIYGHPDALVGVTSMPDIAHYTVSSLFLPFKTTSQSEAERTIRVQGDKIKFEELVDALEKAKGVKYTVNYLPVAEAAAKEEGKRLDGDEDGARSWSIRPLVASGYGVADGLAGSKLDNALFDFTPETLAETLERLFN